MFEIFASLLPFCINSNSLVYNYLFSHEWRLKGVISTELFEPDSQFSLTKIVGFKQSKFSKDGRKF